MLSAKDAQNLSALAGAGPMEVEQYLETILTPEIRSAAADGRTYYKTCGPGGAFARVRHVNGKAVPFEWALRVVHELRRAGYTAEFKEYEERGIVSRHLEVTWSDA